MRKGIVATGIVVLVLGLIGLGAGSAYSSLAGEVAGGVVAALGFITAAVGAALRGS